MKATNPALLLYFFTCSAVILLKFLGCTFYVQGIKIILIPLLFLYYFISKNYRATWIVSLIFLFSFLGDVFNFVSIPKAPLFALYSFLLAKLLLLKLAYNDFRLLKFNNNDRFPILILSLSVVIISVTVLSLQFENLALAFSLYAIYAVVLCVLIFVSIANYIKKPNFAFINLIVMCVFSMFSDIFFIINKFYVSIFVLDLLMLSLHIASYFFMATYFIEKEDSNLLTNQTDEF